MSKESTGFLASQDGGLILPLTVLKSAKGFYIGTSTPDGPYSRESVEYWNEQGAAQVALQNGLWTQRKHP